MAEDEAVIAVPPAPPEPIERVMDPRALEEAVTANDLEQIGVRPRLGSYLRGLWAYRAFTQVLAVSKAEGENQNTYLGQIWTVITPIINASVYVLIFGSAARGSRTPSRSSWWACSCSGSSSARRWPGRIRCRRT